MDISYLFGIDLKFRMMVAWVVVVAIGVACAREAQPDAPADTGFTKHAVCFGDMICPFPGEAVCCGDQRFCCPKGFSCSHSASGEPTCSKPLEETATISTHSRESAQEMDQKCASCLSCPDGEKAICATALCYECFGDRLKRFGHGVGIGPQISARLYPKSNSSLKSIAK
ncbi:hypothetical protein AAMO2058_001310000 [Amorphochlora amoebiformis]